MIEIENMSFWYKEKSKVFESLTMHLETGKIYGLLGENGVGKTTFLRLIAGLLFPKEGKCDVLKFTPGKRQPGFLSSVFYLPEEFEVSRQKADDYACNVGPFYPNFEYNKYATYMQDFGVDGRKKMHEMSFGQKKKTMISLALACNTELLLLDEPTNGLDIPSKAVFRKVVARAADENKCIVISTHQVRDLEFLIDPIVILERNNVLLNESVESITQKLKFAVVSNVPEDALYSEPMMGGFGVVVPNKDGEESKVNIELLFNAAIASRAQFAKLFN